MQYHCTLKSCSTSPASTVRRCSCSYVILNRHILLNVLSRSECRYCWTGKLSVLLGTGLVGLTPKRYQVLIASLSSHKYSQFELLSRQIICVYCPVNVQLHEPKINWCRRVVIAVSGKLCDTRTMLIKPAGKLSEQQWRVLLSVWGDEDYSRKSSLALPLDTNVLQLEENIFHAYMRTVCETCRPAAFISTLSSETSNFMKSLLSLLRAFPKTSLFLVKLLLLLW